jgi:hypothetical protein
MEIKIPIEKLRERKLFVATPMYGGQCAGMFARSCADLSALCTQYGIPLQFYYLFNESLVTRARNYCCDEFMRSEAQHMMFIDSDIGFNPQDVIALMSLQALEEEKYDIIGGPYPKKCISWEKIKHAVDKGVADDDPNVLERFVGDYVFNPKGNQSSIPISEPVEVLEIGTGFMMVSKKAMTKFYDPVSKRYLSEDYWFCQKAHAIGLTTWFCPWMKMQHVGTYIFGGSLADLASIGASATADPGALKSKKMMKSKNK